MELTRSEQKIIRQAEKIERRRRLLWVVYPLTALLVAGNVARATSAGVRFASTASKYGVFSGDGVTQRSDAARPADEMERLLALVRMHADLGRAALASFSALLFSFILWAIWAQIRDRRLAR